MSRVSTLSRTMPIPCVLEASFASEMPYASEAHMHRELAYCRQNGEWFKCTKEQAASKFVAYTKESDAKYRLIRSRRYAKKKSSALSLW